MMKLILAFYDKSSEALKNGASINKIVGLAARERIGRFKYVSEDNKNKEYEDILTQLGGELDEAVKFGAQ